jgi:hypothetical protein
VRAELTLHPVQIYIPAEILAALEDELQNGGLVAGDVFIGGIATTPPTCYFLWHSPGQSPFSALLSPEDLSTPAGARAAAFQFLLKWNQRGLT